MADTPMDIPFSKRLTLNRYICRLFGVESFEDLSVNLRNLVYTGLSEDNLTTCHHTILQTIPIEDSLLSIEDLIRYDQNIISHTNQIKGNRLEGIDWKYFQYIALLFTEVYLDLYFNRREVFYMELPDASKTNLPGILCRLSSAVNPVPAVVILNCSSKKSCIPTSVESQQRQ